MTVFAFWCFCSRSGSPREEVRIGFVHRIRTLPFVGLLLLAILASGLASGLPGAVRFGFAFAALIWIPGWAIVKRVVRPGMAPTLAAPLSVLAGVSALAILAGVCSLLGNDFAVFEACAIWGVVLLLGVAALSRRNTTSPLRTSLWNWRVALFLALAAVAAVQIAPFGVEQDAYDHIGYVRRMLAENKIVSQGVLALPTGVEDAIALDPRKGMFHPVVALLCRLASLDPVLVWSYLPLFLYPLAAFAFLAFCSVFTSSGAAVAVCGVMFLLTYGGNGLRFANEAIYGQNLSVLWFWVIVPALVAGSSRIPRAVLLLLVTGGVLVHAGVALHVAVLGATLVLFSRVLGVDGKCARRDTAVLAAGVAPGLILRLSNAGDPNMLHMHMQGVMHLSPSLFVVSPMEILRQHGLLFLGGLALLPVTFVLARVSTQARRQAAFAVIPVVIALVPWVATFLYERGTYMVFRSLLNIPVYPLIVVTLALLIGWARRSGILARGVVALGLVVWSMMFVAPGLRAVAAAARSYETPPDYARTHADVIAYLNALPSGSVIASDPRTSYALSAYTRHRFVAIYGQHANPYDPYASERLRAVRDLLSPFSTTDAVIQACDRFGVDFVVCDGRTPRRVDEYLALWDKGFFATTQNRLGAIAGRFRRVFESSDVVVFLHDPAGTGNRRWEPPPPPLERSSGEEPYCGVDSPNGDYEISAVSVEPTAVVPGERVRVTLHYRKRGLVPSTLPQTVHLRFDHETIPVAHRYPGEKVVRRFAERRNGERRRFRHDHTPFGGVFPIDYWPIGLGFAETVEVTVPRQARKGHYRIEVSIETMAMLPNFTLDDLLYNRDHYSGVACAELDVRDQVVR